MRFLRNAILAIGLLSLGGAVGCGGSSDTGDTTPAGNMGGDETNPCGDDMGGDDLGGDDLGGDEMNPCGDDMGGDDMGGDDMGGDEGGDDEANPCGDW